MSTRSRQDLPKLFGVPPSPSVELVRWAFSYYEIEYEIRFMAPIFNVIYQLWYRAHDQPIYVNGPLALAEDRQIFDFFDTRAPRGKKLYPQGRDEMVEFERVWDLSLEMAYAARTWAYYHMLPDKKLMYGSMTKGTPWVQRALVWLFYPLFWRVVFKGLKVSEDTERESMRVAPKAFDAVGELLSDGRKYLVGDCFTLADITFCSYAYPLVWPPEFGGAKPELDELDPTLRKTIADYRNTDAGRYVLDIYSKHRVRGPHLGSF